jgi:NADPH:quinone reductase
VFHGTTGPRASRGGTSAEATAAGRLDKQPEAAIFCLHGFLGPRRSPMKAVRVHQPGGPEALRYEDVAEPAARRGHATVAIEAAGVNYIDVYFRKGLYKAELPMTLGLEAAGRVTAVGDGVSEVRVGDAVAFTGVPGAYAETAAVPAQRLVVLPPGVTTRQAAAAMLQGMTAHYLATSTWPLAAGQTCLVHAAAGGVGLLLCQIARMRGARVIGTVSTEAKAEIARGAGADDVVLYSKEDFVERVKELTGGKGVHVVYDGVGAATFLKGFDCLAPRGMMVCYGQASGPVAPFDPQLLNTKGSVFLTRPSLTHYTTAREELVARASAVLGWVRDRKLRLRVDHEYALADAAEAHRALEARRTTGKLLLVP